MKKPKKWTEVYPQGSLAGDEEQAFWKALVRGPSDWRNIASLVKDSGLTRQRVEEIIIKYSEMKPPLIVQSTTANDQWGYWERVPENLYQDKPTLTQKDHQDRVDKHLKSRSDD